MLSEQILISKTELESIPFISIVCKFVWNWYYFFLKCLVFTIGAIYTQNFLCGGFLTTNTVTFNKDTGLFMLSISTWVSLCRFVFHGFCAFHATYLYGIKFLIIFCCVFNICIIDDASHFWYCLLVSSFSPGQFLVRSLLIYWLSRKTRFWFLCGLFCFSVFYFIFTFIFITSFFLDTEFSLFFIF